MRYKPLLLLLVVLAAAFLVSAAITNGDKANDLGVFYGAGYATYNGDMYATSNTQPSSVDNNVYIIVDTHPQSAYIQTTGSVVYTYYPTVYGSGMMYDPYGNLINYYYRNGYYYGNNYGHIYKYDRYYSHHHSYYDDKHHCED